MGGKKARRRPAARPPRPPTPSAARSEEEEPKMDGEVVQEQEDSSSNEEQEEEKQQEKKERRVRPSIPASSCTHLMKGISVEGVQLSLDSALLHGVNEGCVDCNKKQHQRQKKNLKKQGNSNKELWVCLACSHVGCEPDVGTGHAEEHSRRQRHPLVLSFGEEENPSVWCFICKAVLDDDGGTAPKFRLLKQAVDVVSAGMVRARARKLTPSCSSEEVAVAQEEKNGYHGTTTVRGLVNLGNTCFFNSVMQNLLVVKRLQSHFLAAEGGGGEGPLTSALRSFFHEVNSDQQADGDDYNVNGKGRRRQPKRGTTVNPKGLFGAICAKSSRFKGFQQQDSHELLRCLLDGLQVEEERKQGGGEAGKTYVERLFGGVFASTVRCCECGHSSSSLEPFLDLSLPIPNAGSKKKAIISSGGGEAEVLSSKRQIKARKAAERKKQPSIRRSASFGGVTKCETKWELKEVGGTTTITSDSWLDYVAESETPASEEPSTDCLDSIMSDLNLDGVNATTEVVATCSARPESEPQQPAPTPVEAEVEEELPQVASGEVILLPPPEVFYPDQEWEMVTAADADAAEDGEGLGLLFGQEDEMEEVVQGCAERPSTTTTATAASEEEMEPIIEENISPMTLKGCLSAFTRLEVLSGENAWGCEKCSKAEGEDKAEAESESVSESEEGADGAEKKKKRRSKVELVKREATKRMAIQKAPPVLTVHLKRFAMDMRGRLNKLTGHVAFEETLNLNQFQERDANDVYRTFVYRLVGVVEHSGTLRGGHYVSFVKAGTSWWYISDSNVRPSSLEQVLDSEAYLLFYERIDNELLG